MRKAPFGCLQSCYFLKAFQHVSSCFIISDSFVIILIRGTGCGHMEQDVLLQQSHLLKAATYTSCLCSYKRVVFFLFVCLFCSIL